MKKVLCDTQLELLLKKSFGPIRIYCDKGETVFYLFCLFDIPIIEIESDLEYSKYGEEGDFPNVKLDFNWVLGKYRMKSVKEI